MLSIFGPVLGKLSMFFLELVLKRFIKDEKLQKQFDDFKAAMNARGLLSIKLWDSARAQRDRLKNDK